jgi:hypothetical protein
MLNFSTCIVICLELHVSAEYIGSKTEAQVLQMVKYMNAQRKRRQAAKQAVAALHAPIPQAAATAADADDAGEQLLVAELLTSL